MIIISFLVNDIRKSRFVSHILQFFIVPYTENKYCLSVLPNYAFNKVTINKREMTISDDDDGIKTPKTTTYIKKKCTEITSRGKQTHNRLVSVKPMFTSLFPFSFNIYSNFFNIEYYFKHFQCKNRL